MLQGISGHGISNTGMPVGKLLAFTGLTGRLCAFILWEKIMPASLLEGFGLGSELVYKVEIRSQGRK